MACTCTQSQMVMVVLAVLTTSSTGIVYHVKPNSTYNCPSVYKYCHTLAHYVQDVTHFFASHTTMVFLPGTHILPQVNNSHVIAIHNVRDLALEGSDSLSPSPFGLAPEPSSKIQCNGSTTGIEFIRVEGLSIRSLTFSSCGSEHAHHSYYRNSALAFMVASHLSLSSVMVRNNTGYGVYASNTIGISIINSTFAFNSGTHDHYGGNVQLHYSNCYTRSSLHIGFSNFLYGNHNYKDADTSNYPQASGLMIMLESSDVCVMIDHVKLSGNIGGKGGNLAIEVKNTDLIRPIQINNSNISHGHAYDGGGVHLSVVQFKLGAHRNADVLCISNTHIVHNHADHRGGGFFTYTSYTEEEQELQAGGTVTIENCHFHSNSKGQKGKEPSSGGATIDVSNFVPGYIQHGLSKLNFINDTFSHSYDICDSSTSAAAIFLNQQPCASFTDCNFTDNACTALVASRTNILFQGYATVERNNGSNGGGLLLCEGSLMYLFPNTTVHFVNNHAKLSGGAIYVEDTYLQTWPPCFFQLKVNNASQTLNYMKTVHIHFHHNSAAISGSVLYGGSVDRCFLMQYLKHSQKHNSTYAFNTLFSPNNSSSDHSYISSDPVRVCFCDNNIPNCSSTIHSLQVFPGQKFMISVVVVGQRNGAVPGIVLAKYSSSLASIDNSQVVNESHCTKLQYTAYSRHACSSENITLTAHKPGSATSSVKPDQQAVKVHVTLKTCTLGFTLIGDNSQHCGCVSKLEKNGFNCSISNNKNSTCTILHKTPVVPSWIGVCSSKNTTEKGLLYYGHCPFDFCKMGNVDIISTLDTLDQDAQCAYKRRGILCGKCQHKFSLTLGSSKCHKCSDYSLLIIIVFATAGLLLVIFLTACNLTVSEGTINGLIFYANIVQMNWANYFPTPQPHFPNGLTRVLSVFVAWVNLDLGIETCFYDGMDAYAKTWLQFVFPIYLWVIAGIIVLLSRKYTVIARATGKHAVQVLATLILLSFAKLLRTVIAALSYAILHCSTGSGAEHTERVWLSDGSIGYLQGKHIPLFIATVLVFSMLSLPYTLILVFIQCLQKSRMSWIWRLKPLFDAYTAPYKDNYRFWTGHLLLVRIILLAANLVNDRTVNLLITIAACSHIIMLSVLALRGVYKKWTFDILETSFVLNLGVLSAATVAFSKNDAEAGQQVLHMQAGLVCTSVGIAFTTFLGILFFHTCKQIIRSTVWKNLSARISNSQRELEPLLVGNSCQAANEPTSTTLLLPPTFDHSDEYREPLLAYEDT